MENEIRYLYKIKYYIVIFVKQINFDSFKLKLFIKE